ncbi:maleylpyruvate isomerase N-terminal domain-containing protein [Streptomyces sp. NPDC050516]|uniref:maleylpyruvate isomerase N-terminal domain-containing protein n=1 Tax=Streptomyces sp. NPDC050516 TaxID=3365621 RepID=UPI0037AA64DC
MTTADTTSAAVLEEIRRQDGDPRRRILFTGATIVTSDPELGVLSRADLPVEGDTIAAVGADLSRDEYEPVSDDIATAAPDVARVLDGVRGSATRLGATLASLTDQQADRPSLLTGWSRGHVVTHLARSADAYHRLLTLARTGAEGLGLTWTLSATGPRVSGGGHALLAWLAGRGGASRLRSELPLPVPRRWPLPPAPGWG